MTNLVYTGMKLLSLRKLAALLVVVVVISSVLVGGVRTNAQDHPNIDSQAAKLLQDMSDFLGSKYEYTFKADVMFDEVIDSKRKLQYSATETVYVKKPNQLAIEYVSDLGGYKLWYDGNQATILEVPGNLFSLATLGGSVNSILTKLEDKYDFIPALSEFLFINTKKVLTENVTSGTYFGGSKVFGKRCQHLAFEEQNIDWQIWIEDGKRPIPRKLVITYKNKPGSPQFIAILKDWIFEKPITNYAFKADIPNLNKRTEFEEIAGNPKYKIGSVRRDR